MLSPRFTLLLLFCGLSVQWLPMASVNAAAISHPPQARRSVPNTYQDSSHLQRFLPWSAHDKRMADNYPTNAFAKFAHAVLSGIKQKMHHKRSPYKSIIIPSNRGGAYVLPHSRREAPRWKIGQPGASPQRRETEEGVPGTVGIMSNMDSSKSNGTLLASLLVNHANGALVLDASDTNKTVLYLVGAPDNSTSRDPTSPTDNDSTVRLVMLSSSNQSPSCATYDPNPAQPSPMRMAECAADANMTTHMSQMFMYNKISGVIRPTWFLGQDDGTHDITSGQDVSSDSNSTSSAVSANATDTATSTQPTSSTLSRRDDFQGNAQNITLVFIPAGRPVSAAAASDNTTASSVASQSYTVSASGSISATPVALPTDSSSAASPSQSADGLKVELVGDGSLSVSSSASSTSVVSGSSTMTTLATVSSSMPGLRSVAGSSASSIDAAAVASSIAAARSSSSAAASSALSSASSSASYTASLSSPSASMSVADVSPSTPSSDSASASVSASSAQASTSNTQASSTFVAAVFQRNAPKVTPVSTEPYQWKFRAESR